MNVEKPEAGGSNTPELSENPGDTPASVRKQDIPPGQPEVSADSLTAAPEATASEETGPRDLIAVGIGASAGGLEAFTDLVSHLPAATGMAFILVQHLDPHHESALPGLLAGRTPIPVLQVHNDTRIEPDHIYVIPPNTLESPIFVSFSHFYSVESGHG